MSTSLNQEYYKAAVEKYDLANHLKNNGNLPAAIKTITEAEQFFLKTGNRSMQMICRYRQLHWGYMVNPSSYYAENEQDVLTFFEDFRNFYDDRRYILVRFNYFKYLLESARRDDHEETIEALNRLSDFVLANKRHLSFISENQEKIWRAQAKSIEAQDSTSRRDDLATQAEHYFEAAKLSTPADETDSLSRQMLRYKNSYLSTAYKLKAFNMLRSGKFPDYDQVADSMRRAMEYAESAEHYSEITESAIHKTYISYWYNIFSARAELCKSDFQKSIDFLNLGVSDATYLQAQGVNIFPNHFANIDDLRNDRLFVRANQLIDEGDPTKSLLKLEKWLNRSIEQQGTWRYNTIKLRFLATQILAKLNSVFMKKSNDRLSSFAISAKYLQKEIDALIKQVRLGKASMKLAELILFLALDYERGKLTLESFCDDYLEILNLFPPDSALEDYEAIAPIIPVSNESAFATLPQCIFKELERVFGVAADQISLDEIDQLLTCYTAVLGEYRYLKYLDVQSADWAGKIMKDYKVSFDGETLENQLEKLCVISKALGEDVDGLEPLTRYVDKRYSQDETDNIETLASLARKAIEKTHGLFFPHIVQVLSDPAEEGGREDDRFSEYYVSERIWNKKWPQKLFFGREWPLRRGRYYYLEPRWKNFNFEKAPFYRRENKPYESVLYKAIELYFQDNAESARQKRLHAHWLFLEEKLQKLEKLVNEDAREVQISRYLKANQWVFGHDYKSFVAQPRIDLDNRPDYFLVTFRNENVLVELKRPGARLFIRTKNENPESDIWEKQPRLCESSKLTKAINQLREYQVAFKKRLMTERRGWVQEYEPRGILLIGNTLSQDEAEKLKEINTEQNRNLRDIMTYSQLISKARGIIDYYRGLPLCVNEEEKAKR
jgi:hypothetical protein